MKQEAIMDRLKCYFGAPPLAHRRLDPCGVLNDVKGHTFKFHQGMAEV
jgi:hypothetical protein